MRYGNKLVNASYEISATSKVKNYKIGFRLGVKMMCDGLLFEESETFKGVLKERFLTYEKTIICLITTVEIRNDKKSS